MKNNAIFFDCDGYVEDTRLVLGSDDDGCTLRLVWNDNAKDARHIVTAVFP